MSQRTKRLSLGLTFVAMVAVLGMKDTGVFLKDYTYQNNSEIAYFAEQNVNIIKEDQFNYYVKSGEQDIAVPKDTLLKKTESNKAVKAINPTRLYESIDGEVIRIILSDEFVDIIEVQDNYYKVRSNDDKVGFVKAGDVVKADKPFYTSGIAKTDKFLVNNDLLLELKDGKKVNIADFVFGQYILVDDQGNFFQADISDIELDVPKMPKPVVTAAKPVAETTPAEVVNVDEAPEVQPEKKDEVEKTEAKPKVPAPVPESAEAKEKIAFAIEYMKAQLGRPYVYADTGKNGYDCSGLMYDTFYNQLKIKMHRSSYDIVNDGYEVAREDLLPGDMILFNTTSTDNSHVGMYLGNDEFIHASSGSGKVVITKLSTKYYDQRYSTARRLIVD